ncbi:hypothetical protein EDI_097540 [Entamoeba dispar SAW760]|uniref:Uncharacterized protein n=1 Tax=Entamoeba dispar (strain ATCC PRA-260 / SAW760) TaxID=370354 RepID=B0EDZ8_ENTDS|nr:uncharacterized protein EDI_097540 [Entamoeba dispar SAW760]EDR27251.1 hypothetical protein EDI_097540 [Entamoeba dispar SAW760]|eukprot:EDR27251.1 hypothetical protein EDI_097540 [Entamoeba dispar SAW760]
MEEQKEHTTIEYKNQINEVRISNILIGLSSGIIGIIHLQEIIVIIGGYFTEQAKEIVLTTKLIGATLITLMGIIGFEMKYRGCFLLLTGISLSYYSIFVHENDFISLYKTVESSTSIEWIGGITWFIFYIVAIHLFNKPRLLVYLNMSLVIYQFSRLLLHITPIIRKNIIMKMIFGSINIIIVIISNIFAIWNFYPSMRRYKEDKENKKEKEEKKKED